MKKIFLLSLFSSALFAKGTHYDLGLGGILVNYPSYMGSKNNNLLFSPLPYLDYQGEKTTIDRGNIERKLFDLKDLTLDISLGGSLPADSEKSKVREGMDDLQLAFEIGPRIKYRFYHDEVHEFFFRLPIRAVFTTNFSNIDDQGYLLTPDLRYEYKHSNIEFTFNTGPLWASEKYHDYFYSVKAKDVTINRPEYHAKGGYSGYRNSMGIKYSKNSWVYGGFLAHFNLNGAEFDPSPLVETHTALFSGAYIAYIFYSK